MSKCTFVFWCREVESTMLLVHSIITSSRHHCCFFSHLMALWSF